MSHRFYGKPRMAKPVDGGSGAYKPKASPLPLGSPQPPTMQQQSMLHQPETVAKRPRAEGEGIRRVRPTPVPASNASRNEAVLSRKVAERPAGPATLVTAATTSAAPSVAARGYYGPPQAQYYDDVALPVTPSSMADSMDMLSGAYDVEVESHARTDSTGVRNHAATAQSAMALSLHQAEGSALSAVAEAHIRRSEEMRPELAPMSIALPVGSELSQQLSRFDSLSAPFEFHDSRFSYISGLGGPDVSLPPFGAPVSGPGDRSIESATLASHLLSGGAGSSIPSSTGGPGPASATPLLTSSIAVGNEGGSGGSEIFYVCLICGVRMSEETFLQRHVQTCLARCEAAEGTTDTYVLMLAEARTADGKEWRLSFEMPMKASTVELDYFMRAMWTECCNHTSYLMGDPVARWEADEVNRPALRGVGQPMSTVFQPHSVVELSYKYEELLVHLKVLSVRNGAGRRPPYMLAKLPSALEPYQSTCESADTFIHPIVLLGRNVPYSGLSVNSPRIGHCCFEGGFEVPYGYALTYTRCSFLGLLNG